METENSEHIICPNCENEFCHENEFCPHCGQKNRKLELKLKYLLQDFVSSSFNLDSKIFLTLHLLIFKPGKLTKLFFQGKRTTYIPPVRLYLIISLVYFTILSMVNADLVKLQEMGENNTPTIDTLVSNSQISGSSAYTDTLSKDVIVTMNNSESIESFISIKEDSIADTVQERGWNKMANDRLNKIKTKEGKEAFTQMFRSYVSIGMFILMPLTALIFFLLFYKGTPYLFVSHNKPSLSILLKFKKIMFIKHMISVI